MCVLERAGRGERRGEGGKGFFLFADTSVAEGTRIDLEGNTVFLRRKKKTICFTV